MAVRLSGMVALAKAAILCVADGGMMAKAPAFQFYVKDWLSDTQLQMASFATRGMWINFLCFMWEAPERGKLTGSYQQLAKLIGATDNEIALFMADVKILNFCSYAECDGIVTLINRRMNNEWKEKESAKLRMQKMRGGGEVLRESYGECDANVPRARARQLENEDIDIKTKYLDCVFLTEQELQKLVTKNGQFLTDKAISILNNYIMGKGRDPYKSHYHTLIGWPMERAREKYGQSDGRGARNSGGGSGVQTTPPERVPEKPISEEQRLANLERVKGLISRIG